MLQTRGKTMEEEGPFVEDGVDLEDWNRRVRNVNAALRNLQVDAGVSDKAKKTAAKKTKQKRKPLTGGASSPSLP
jgi:hypothetical protein